MAELLTWGRTLGELIRFAREQKGMSRAKLAEFTDTPPNSLIRYEKAGTEDGRYPSLQKLAAICEVLEIDPRQAFDAVNNEGVEDQRDISFRFTSHFRRDEDWLNWKLSVKDIGDLNDHLDQLSFQHHTVEERLARIERALNQNGPDQGDPSRPENQTNNLEAVGAASTKPQKGEGG